MHTLYGGDAYGRIQRTAIKRNRREIYEGTAYAGTRGEEMPSGFLTTFKIRFTISLCLFGFFAWMSLTGKEIYHISADQIEAAVESDILQGQISDCLIKLGLYE